MSNFINLIKKAVKRSKCMNDKRIMITALNILDLEFVINNEEIVYLNEIFTALKEDYTLFVTSDEDTLEQVIVMKKQEVPIVENKHDVDTLYKELSNFMTNNLEGVVLNFFRACEHIEEVEVMIINQIIDMLENNWCLRSIERKKEDDNDIRVIKFRPNYNKVNVLKK